MKKWENGTNKQWIQRNISFKQRLLSWTAEGITQRRVIVTNSLVSNRKQRKK